MRKMNFTLIRDTVPWFRLIFLFLTLLPLAAATVPSAHGTPAAPTGKVTDPVETGLDHLLSVVDPSRSAPLDWQLVSPVVEFVSAKKDPQSPRIRNRRGAPAAYYEFDIDTGLSRVLEYAYNPDIPTSAMLPSSVRWSEWIAVEGHPKLPPLWKHLPTVSTPIVVRARERTEITPDQTTEAYYRYDEHRTLILGTVGGRRCLVSLSKQADTSDVGRKGIVLGPDSEWNYLYSGEEGLSRPVPCGLSTYIYDSFGVTVFVERADGKPGVRGAYFRWLRGGWGWVNMVRSDNILEGLKRFSADFKNILEDPRLPPAADLARRFAHFEGRSEQQLRQDVQHYLAALKTRFEGELGRSASFEDILVSGEYLNGLTRREMYAILVVEHMKSLLGKGSFLDQRLGMLRP